MKLRASLGNSARNPFRHSGNFTDPPEQLHQEERGKSIFDDLVVEAPKVQKDSNMSIGKGKRKKSLESTEVGGMKQSKLSFDARQTPTNNKKTGLVED